MHASRSSFAITCCSALLAAACARGSTDAHTTDDATPSSPASPSAVPSAQDAGDASSHADPYLTGRPVRAKSVGHTSYALKLTLDDGSVALFKPRSKLPLGDRRYRGEIAAYRLAVALGLDNVRRAIPRAFRASDLRPAAEGFDDKALVDADGRVRGALMPWLDTYRVLPLEEPTWRARWEPWVLDLRATVPPDERSRAASISTMIGFDYITANWDRWSGGNVAEDSATGKVLFVDNDGAFYDPPEMASLQRQLAQVRRIARFSRRFVAALRALDASKIASAIGDEAAGTPLLPRRVVDGADARRRNVLEAVDARIGDAGETETLAFE
jgi:hypothetical protein